MTLDRKELPKYREEAQPLASAFKRMRATDNDAKSMPEVVLELIDEIAFLDKKIDGAREMLRTCEQGLTHALHPYGDREAAEHIHEDLKLMLNDYPAWLKKHEK